MNLSSLATGFCLQAGLIMAIGAQNVFVLRQGLRREHVGPIVLFCATADLALTGAGVAGMGGALRAVPGLAIVLTLGGACFLGVYGLGALCRALRPDRMVVDANARSSTLRRALMQAAAFTLLNPHVYLDTVLLMGTVGQAQLPEARATFVLGAGGASAAWFSSIGFGARVLAPLFERRAAWRVLDGLVAAVMLFLAATLAWTAFR